MYSFILFQSVVDWCVSVYLQLGKHLLLYSWVFFMTAILPTTSWDYWKQKNTKKWHAWMLNENSHFNIVWNHYLSPAAPSLNINRRQHKVPGSVWRFSEYERTDDLIGMINVKRKSEWSMNRLLMWMDTCRWRFEAVTDGAKQKAALLHSPWYNVYPGLNPCTLWISELVSPHITIANWAWVKYQRPAQ